MEKKPLSKIFTPRRAYKPFEYPETMTFVELMQKSYWVHSEVNFDPDIQDFKSYLYPYEQEAIKRALLGIAQVEVSVKTFWGDLYDIFPKPEFNCLGMSFGECHIEGTEIMTERGFIDFRDLKMTDKVATFDEDRKITFVKPDNIINKYYKGEMYSFDNTFIRAVVTPNHRFATYTGKDNIYRHIEASNIDYKRKNIRIPVSGFLKDSASVLTPTDRLKIAIELFARKKDVRNINFKDYYPYKIRIKDTDTYAKSRIEEIFKELPHIQVRRSIDSFGYATYDFQLNKFEGNARKFDWVMEDTRRFDRKFAYSFINELISYNIRTGHYTSTKKEQADIVQFLSAVAGYRTILSTVEDKREDKNGHKRYVIYINKKDFCTFQTLQPKKINYEGNVYCATVKNTGNLITRYKDKILFSGNSECYDKETQILTNTGFKYFNDLTENDKVAQYNMQDKSVTFVKPISYTKKPFKGKLHHYLGKTIDLMVTPNHEIIVENPRTGLTKKVKSYTGTWGRNYFAPASGYKKGNKEFTTLDRLLIAIQADGCLFGNTPTGKIANRLDFMFVLRKERKIERIIGFLDELNIKYNLSKRKNGMTTINASLKNYITVDVIEKIKTFSYINLEDIDADWGMQFLEELKHWDGSSKKGYNNHFVYYNSREEAIDKVIEICAISGYRTCKGINRTAEQGLKIPVPGNNNKRKSSKTCWALTITPMDRTCYPHRTEVDYDDFVYCVTVPTGCVITRRNKGVVVSGNSRHSEAYSRLLEVLGYEEEFENILSIPIFQKREEIIRNKLKKTENSIEKILFFTLIIENASLFSQFATILSMTKFKGRLKSTANMIAWTSIDENCLDLETTKILTVKGWTVLRDVKEGDEVFAFSDGKIKVEKVLKTTKRKLGKEKMFKFGNSYSNILMTAGHDVIFKDSKTGRYLKTRADHFRKSGHKLIPITGHLESKKDSVLSDKEKLMIAIQCDGHLRKLRNSKGELTYMGQVNGGKNVVFAMKREDKIKKLEGLLKNLKIDFTKSETNEKGYITFRFNYDLWNKPFPKRYDWVNLRNMNKKYAEDFISEVLSWGSSYTEVGTLVYSTRDKELAEFLQAIGTLAGYVVNFKKRRRKGDKISYNLNFIYKDFETISSTSYKAIEVEKSEDTEVGCVTVPSGGIIVKHELGRPMITGNCHANAGTWIINSILAENPEYRDSLESYITHEVIEYMKMEDEMIDWIFECGELQHLPKKHLKDYMRYRIDTSLENLGFGRAFGTNSSHLIPLQWFEEEVFSGETDDFFAKRPTAYTKHDQSITKDDLF